MRRNVMTVSLNCTTIVCLSSVCVFLRDICFREDNASGTRKLNNCTWHHLHLLLIVSRNAPKYAQIVRASIILLVVYGIWDLKELFMHQDEFRPETTGWWIVMLIDILIDSMRGFFIASVYCFRLDRANWTWHLHLTTCLLIAIPKLGKK